MQIPKILPNAGQNDPHRDVKEKPTVTLNMINVGWGDCFLITLLEAVENKVYRILSGGRNCDYTSEFVS